MGRSYSGATEIKIQYMMMRTGADYEIVSGRFSKFLASFLLTGPRWYKNERLPKSDDFRRTTVGTTHIIQSGQIMARWKGKSLDYVGKLVSDLC